MGEECGDADRGDGRIERPGGGAAEHGDSDGAAPGCLPEERCGAATRRRVKDNGPLLGRCCLEVGEASAPDGRGRTGTDPYDVASV